MPGYLLDEKNPTRLIFKLALPAILNELSLSFVLAVDTAFAGRLGSLQIGAIGLMGVLVWNLSVVGDGLAVGLASCIARKSGSGEHDESKVFARTGLVSTFVFSALIVPVFWFLRRGLYRVLQVPEELLAGSDEYFSVLLLFLPFLYLSSALNACYRAAGDTRTPMLTGVLVNLINIFLDWTLMFGRLGFPNMGIRGAALASGVSIAAGCVVLIACSRRKGWFPFRRTIRFSFSHLRRILTISIPNALERLAMSVSQLLVVAFAVNPLGAMNLSAFQVAMRLASFTFTPGFGFGTAASTLVGHCLGAKDPERAERMIWITTGYCFLVLTALCALLFAFPDFFARIFTDDRTLIDLVRLPLRIYAVMGIGLTPTMVLNSALQGAGDTRYPMIVMFASRFIVRLPGAYIAGIVLGFGLPGVWAMMNLDFIVRGILLFLHTRGGKWKTRQV